MGLNKDDVATLWISNLEISIRLGSRGTVVAVEFDSGADVHGNTHVMLRKLTLISPLFADEAKRVTNLVDQAIDMAAQAVARSVGK